MQWSASALSTAGVWPGHGPSSKVSTTSPARRKSCILKCSQPKPGPPVVSTSTVRAIPSALGLPGQEAVGVAAGDGVAASAGAAAGAGAGVAGAGVGAGARDCPQAAPTAPRDTDIKIAHALATRIADS